MKWFLFLFSFSLIGPSQASLQCLEVLKAESTLAQAGLVAGFTGYKFKEWHVKRRIQDWERQNLPKIKNDPKLKMAWEEVKTSWFVKYFLESFSSGSGFDRNAAMLLLNEHLDSKVDNRPNLLVQRDEDLMNTLYSRDHERINSFYKSTSQEVKKANFSKLLVNFNELRIFRNVSQGLKGSKPIAHVDFHELNNLLTRLDVSISYSPNQSEGKAFSFTNSRGQVKKFKSLEELFKTYDNSKWATFSKLAKAGDVTLPKKARLMSTFQELVYKPKKGMSIKLGKGLRGVMGGVAGMAITAGTIAAGYYSFNPEAETCSEDQVGKNITAYFTHQDGTAQSDLAKGMLNSCLRPEVLAEICTATTQAINHEARERIGERRESSSISL